MSKEFELSEALMSENPETAVAAVIKTLEEGEFFVNDEDGNLSMSFLQALLLPQGEKIFGEIAKRTSIETLHEMGIATTLANNRYYDAIRFILKKGYDINTRVDGGKDLFTAVAEQMGPDPDSNDMRFLIELINGKKIFGLEGAIADLVIFGIKNGAINPKTELTFTYKEKVETGRLPIKFHTFFGNNAKIEELLKNYSAGKTAEEVEAVKDALKKQNEIYFAPHTIGSSVAPMVGGEGGGGGGRGGGGNAATSSSVVGARITERGGGAAEADRAGSAAASGGGGEKSYAKLASTPASTARVSPSGHPPKPDKGCCTVS